MNRIDGIDVGETLPTLEKNFNRPQLFRYSGITWNPHRVHYDSEFATEVEGHPDVLVHGSLHGATMAQHILDWVGQEGKLIELSWRNVGRATPEQTLFVESEVTSLDTEVGEVALEVWTRTNEDRCAEGAAKIRFDKP